MSLSSGQLAFYKLSDATAQTGTDLTETGLGITYGAGKVGNAVILPGGGSRLISTDSVFALDGPVSRTFAIWVDLTALATSPGIMGNFAGGGGGVVQWLLWHDSGKLKFRVRDAGNTDHEIEWPGLSTGQFYFIVATFNGATGDLTLNVDNGTALTANAPTLKEGTTSFELGNRNNGGDGMIGLLDAFGVWDHVLSANDQTTLFNAAAGLEAPFSEIVAGDTGIGYGFNFF